MKDKIIEFPGSDKSEEEMNVREYMLAHPELDVGEEELFNEDEIFDDEFENRAKLGENNPQFNIETKLHDLRERQKPYKDRSYNELNTFEKKIRENQMDEFQVIAKDICEDFLKS